MSELSTFATSLGLRTGEPRKPGDWDRYQLDQLRPGYRIRWQDREWRVVHTDGPLTRLCIELRREDERGGMASTMIIADGTFCTNSTVADVIAGHLPLDDDKWW